MRHLQTIIAVLGILLVVLIDLLPDLSYKGMQHPVGSDAVQVFEPGPTNHEFELPVWRNDTSGFINTGQRVRVYLRSDYHDRHFLAKQNLTSIVIEFFILAYLLAGILVQRVSAHSSRSV